MDFTKFKNKRFIRPKSANSDIYNGSILASSHNTMSNLANKRTNQLNKQKARTRALSVSDMSDSTFGDDSDGSIRSARSVNIKRNPDMFSNGNMNVRSIPERPDCFIDTCNKIVDNRNHEQKFVDNPGESNNFLSQFEPMRFDNPDPSSPVSSNAVGNKIGHNAGVARYETERALALDGGWSKFSDESMTYGIVDPSNFDKLQPYFSGKGGYGSDTLNQEHINSRAQRKNELFSGSLNNLDYRPKIERSPLFNPVVGLTNIYGSPVMTDFYEKRYEPSREKRNELPFQQVRVTPGLGLGANENNKQGYQDMLRVMPKTVDELRTKDNPKISYPGRIVEGMKGHKGPIVAKSYKRRPNTFMEMGSEWLIPGVGEIKAPKIEGEYNPGTLATINRGTMETNYHGPAKSTIDKPTPDGLIPKSHEPNKQNWLHAEPRNVQVNESQKSSNFINTYTPSDTQRAMGNNYLGPAGNEANGKTIAYNPNDVPDLTNREIYGKADRAGATVGTASFMKPKVMSFNDVPDMTQREIFIKTDRSGAAIGTSQFAKPQAMNFTDVPDLTMRNLHGTLDRAGQAIGGSQFSKGPSMNFADVPDLNMRNIHGQPDRAGQSVGGPQFSKGQAMNFADVPDMTMRNIHGQPDRAGQSIGSNQFTQLPATNFSDVPDITMRNIHNSPDRAGQGIGSGPLNKLPATNFSDVPDMTMRNVHNKFDRAGQAIGSGPLNKNPATNFNDVPDMTMRNIHNKFDRAGQGIGSGPLNKNPATNFNDVPDMNMRNTHSKTDRAGQGIGAGQFNKNPATNFNDVPDMTMRNIHNKFDRAGQGIGGSQFNKNPATNFADVQDLTMRDIHNKLDRAGASMGNSQFTGPKAENFTDIPDLTMRAIHGQTDRAGVAGNGQMSKAKAANFDDIPDLTMRDIHGKHDRAGVAGSGQLSKSYAFDFVNNIPEVTMRNIHEKTDRAGIAGNIQFTKGYAFDFVNNVPDMTFREMQAPNNYLGPVKQVVDKDRSRADVNNMNVNIIKEVISQGRAPTLSSCSKGPTFAFTSFEPKIPLQLNRELYPDANQDSFHRINPNITKMPLNVPNDQTRFYSHVKDNLKGNPYINNIVHKSPIY